MVEKLVNFTMVGFYGLEKMESVAGALKITIELD